MTHARPDVGSMPEPHMKRLIVIGAGGYGRVCLDIARMSGYEVIGFCDAAQPDGARINGVPVLGGNEIILAGSRSDDASFVVAIGDQFLKRELAELTIHVGCKLETLIHPSATISPHASIGDGTVVMPNCVVNANGASAPTAKHARPSSSSSRDGTIRAGAIPPSAICRRSTTKGNIYPPLTQIRNTPRNRGNSTRMASLPPCGGGSGWG